MAAAGGAAPLPRCLRFQAGLKQPEVMKTGMREPVEPDARDIQVVCVGEPPGRVTPIRVKQEPEAAGWEAEEKGELRVARSQSGREHLLLTGPFASFEGMTGTCKWLAGELGVWPVSALVVDGHQPSLRSNDAGVRQDCGKGMTALRRERDGVETRRQRFPEARGLREVYCELRALCHRWLKPERRSKEQIVELVILEQFLAVLPQELQGWVRERDPESCAHVIGLVEDFLRRQQEAEQWEQQDPRPFVEVVVNSPEGERDPAEAWEGALFKEIKQEWKRDAGSLGVSTPCEEKDGLQRLWGPAQTCRKFPGEAAGHLALSCKNFAEGCGSKKLQEQPPMIWGEASVPGKAARSLEEAGCHSRTIQHLCPECGQNFQHKSTLIRHQKMHSGEKPHVCLECGKTFHRRDKLIRHQRIHTGQKPHACPECGKSFRERGKLISHQRIHTGEKPFTCPACEKTYRWKEEFVKHLRVHMRERPCKCFHCGKSFISQSHLVSHHRSHTGEKPYGCPECQRGFCSKESLNKHQRVHLGEKSYECHDCGKRYQYISNFVKHQRIHVSERIL
ncbi:uncharacterized protein PHA67_004587 isoform 2-T2 [Liasis olivaceus]